MFDTMFDFRTRRNWKQAIWFYLFFSVMAFLIAMVAAFLFLPEAHSFQEGMMLGAHHPLLKWFRVIVSGGLGGVLLWKKGLYKSPTSVMLVLVAVVLSVMTGTLLGLIPVAYLSTRPAMDKETA